MYTVMLMVAAVAAFAVFLVGYLLPGRRKLVSPGGSASRYPRLERLTGWGTALFFLLLVLSGFWYLAMNQPRMTGNALMAHVTFGSIFAGIILIYAILRAHACGPGAAGCPFLYKFAFWGFLLSALVLILTAIGPMLPWLGTHGQEEAVAYHRYSAAASLFFGILLALLRTVRR